MLCFPSNLMSRLRRYAIVLLRLLIVGVCCLGVWYSLLTARAEFLFKIDTEDSIRSAIRLAPDNENLYMRLAQFDRTHALSLLQKALSLNAYNAQAYIELGLQYEANGDSARAESLLLGAFGVDRTYLPRWTLANFYFRQGNLPAFWEWARRAAEMPAEDIRALFDLCWRASPDADVIQRSVLNDKPEVIRQYISFMIGKNQLAAAATLAPRLIDFGSAETDRPLLFYILNRLISMNSAKPSVILWRHLIEKKWVVAGSALPNNGDFAREPISVSFDWSLNEFDGLHSWPGSSGLETEFSGSEPETCVVAEQTLSLDPGSYAMSFSYHTSGIPPGSGLKWQVIDPATDAIVSASPDLSSESVAFSGMGFVVRPGAGLLRLRLVYERALGTTRITGTSVVVSTKVEKLATK